MAASCRGLEAPAKGALRPFMTIGCSGAACRLVNDALGGSWEVEERAAALLAGGILTNGYQCGVVWGAALAAGAEAHRRLGPGAAAEREALDAARELVEAFRSQNGHVDCVDLTDTDWQSRWQMLRYMLRGQSVGCYRMLRRFVPEACNRLVARRAGSPPEPVPGATPCTAVLARRLDMSEAQAVMAAGLAGGIGLTGGGCGALATAVWSVALADGEESGGVDFQDPRARAVIEGFLAATDYEFECARIAGRVFEGADDHAAFVAAGGCANVLDALEAACPAGDRPYAGPRGE